MPNNKEKDTKIQESEDTMKKDVEKVSKNKETKEVKLGQEEKNKEMEKEETSKMNPMQSKKTTMMLAAAIIVVVVVALLYVFRGSYLAAMVNGKPIWKWSLATKLEDTYGETVLDQMILEALIYQEADKQNVSIDTAVIDTELQAIEAQVVAQGMTLESALAAEGLTEESLRSQIELQKIAETIAASNISVTDEEIDTYLEENKDYLSDELSEGELRLQAGNDLQSQKQNEAIQAWVTGLQTDAKINNFVAPDDEVAL